MREFSVDPDDNFKAGDNVTTSIFEGIPFVDVTAMSKGRGFQGVVRRYRMAGGRMSHGGRAKRKPGSIGCSASPARVMKGKHLPGHMGYRSTTTQNLKVVRIVTEDNIMLVHGAVPGPAGGVVLVTKALKKKAS